MNKVWINPSSIFDTFIVMGDDGIVSANLKEARLEGARQRIKNGEGVLNVLSDDDVFINNYKIASWLY